MFGSRGLFYPKEYPIYKYLEHQVSYFLKPTLPLKPATIGLKIGHLAFQVGEITYWS